MNLLFWVPNGLLAALVLMSGAFNVTHQPNVMEMLQHLGFPPYVATMLGVWKLLAALALVAGARWPRLREWAFAGLFFDFSGALVSHLAVGDGFAMTAPSAVLLLLTGATWLTTSGPTNRRA